MIAKVSKVRIIWLYAVSLGLATWAQPSPLQTVVHTPTEKTPATQSAHATVQGRFPLDQFREFSAIMVGGPVPGTDDEIHIYRSGNLMRMEANEGKSYQITDLTIHETHGIEKGGCLKYASPYIRSYPFSFSSPDNKFERVKVGKETIDGHICQIEDVTITLPKNPNPAKIRLWEAEDLQGFPVKIETGMRRIIRYKDVILGSQDPTLFIFPDDCQVAERPLGNHRPQSPRTRQPRDRNKVLIKTSAR